MKIKIIDSNHDILGNEYFLTKINLKFLSDLLKEKWKDINFEQFNENYNNEHYQLIDKKIKPIYQNQEKWALENINNKEELNNFIFNTAIENGFISLNVPGFNGSIDVDTKLYLIDGYRRLLYDFRFIERNLNQNVYVKLYTENLSAIDSSKLLFHLNLWKMNKDHGYFGGQINKSKVWFDRGWRFFIYLKYGLMFNDWLFYLLDRYINIEKMYYLDVYKIISNERFIFDLAQLNDISLTKYEHNDVILKSVIANVLGKRRLNGDEFRFLLKDFDKFYKLKLNDMIKISEMTRTSSIENKLYGLVKEFFNIISDKIDYEKFLKIEVQKNTYLTQQQFIDGLDKKIISKYQINNNDTIHTFSVKNHRFTYKNSKIYEVVLGLYSDPLARIFLFLGEYKILKMPKLYGLHKLGIWRIHKINDDIYDSAHQAGFIKPIFHSNNKEELLDKINEMFNIKVKLNNRKTEFL